MCVKIAAKHGSKLNNLYFRNYTLYQLYIIYFFNYIKIKNDTIIIVLYLYITIIEWLFHTKQIILRMFLK
jgi:hypothetical protein